MTILRQLFAAMLCACAVFAATPALAADFSFTVPVDVSSLPPSIERGSVRCLVQQWVPGSAVNIGEGSSAEFAITGGAYRGSVTVEVTHGSSADPAQANKYDCLLWFFVRRSSGATSWYSSYSLAQETGPIEARILSTASSPGVRSYQAGGDIPH